MPTDRSRRTRLHSIPKGYQNMGPRTRTAIGISMQLLQMPRALTAGFEPSDSSVPDRKVDKRRDFLQ
jgi:hypothetical protein